ncbi:hypothetical protein MMC30_009217 [Trapelia coarctata]|nr:hypothetical protein [Trapelia coarctata]
MAFAISFGDANSGFQAGIINGPVSTEFHLPPERPETSPKPSAVVPFTRDADFVERSEIFDQVQQKCAAPGSRTALVGLGGVGKSQLAIEFAYRTQERSPETWVFWVHASNAARFKQSYRDIASCVKAYGRQNPKMNILQLVHDWLRNERKGKWVLILDNVDDISYLFEAQSAFQDGQTNELEGKNGQPLIRYLPRCPNGSILITTRNKLAALKLVEERDIIVVEPMKPADALTLLQKKLGNQDNSNEVSKLAALLEFMPLAIVQAAAYISQQRPRYSVQQYLEDFRKSDGKKASLLNYEGGQLRRDWEAKNSIITTWQISFDHIRQIRQSAADLLSLMSLFDRQGISEALVRNRVEIKTSNQFQHKRRPRAIRYIIRVFDRNSKSQEAHEENSEHADEFENDLLMLRNYSFISVTEDRTTFEMHALVQLAMRKWLEASGQLEKWRQQFVRNLCAEFPTGEYENWERCQALFPHAKSAAAQQPEGQRSLRDWASILYKAAWYAWRMGDGVEAEKMSVQVVRVRRKMLGKKHEDTLEGIAMLGLAYNLRGLWEAAEELEVQVMETSKKKLGADHPDTLTSMANLASTMANLASTYWNQGRWDAAEELGVQVTETSKKILGADHPFTLTSIGNLASTYRNQGRWDAAEELQVQVTETSKKILGADHPDTLTSMANLASTYRNQGRWDAAEELDVQVMETSKKKLGADHPDTLTCMNNLAFTWKGQGRDADAINLMKDCVRLRGRVLRTEHPYFVTSSAVLAAWEAERAEMRGPDSRNVAE